VGAGWKEQLLKLQQRYPGKPILVVEFGHPALEGIFNNTLGEDAQALSLEAQFAGLTNDAVCGALIWCYAHHPWPEEPFINYMTTAPFGVVTRDRRRLAAWPIVQRMFHQRHGREVPQPQKDACGTSRDIGIQMQRPHMRDIPQHPLPEGYSIRPMRKTDGALWTDVQRDSEPILRIDDNLFWREFGNDPQAIERRCFLIYDSQNLAVGTISAWYIRGFKGKDAGRIHWIAIRPSQRGKGLARSAMTFAMNQLAQWHEAACLTASNSRLTAIKIYLEFGFLPDVENDAQAAAWRQVAAELDHPALASFRV
jgi:GNAT superfamily N-acetyltransferase